MRQSIYGAAELVVQWFNLIGDIWRSGVVGREFDGRVKAISGRIDRLEGLGVGKKKFAKTIFVAPLAPATRQFFWPMAIDSVDIPLAAAGL
jgi:hypothetical protein